MQTDWEFSPKSVSVIEGALDPNSSAAGTWVHYYLLYHGTLPRPFTPTYKVTGRIGPNLQPADGADFVGGSLPVGHVFFPGNPRVGHVSLYIHGDNVRESDEGFTVSLYGATGNLLPASATGTILNDDFRVFKGPFGDLGPFPPKP